MINIKEAEPRYESDLTVDEFAAHLKVSRKTALIMTKSTEFRNLKISRDICIKPGHKRANWRISLKRYEQAKDKGKI